MNFLKIVLFLILFPISGQTTWAVKDHNNEQVVQEGQTLEKFGEPAYFGGPLKNANRDIWEQRGKSRRTLKRDGSGPNKDGRGPRGSNLGSRNGCPNK